MDFFPASMVAPHVQTGPAHRQQSHHAQAHLVCTCGQLQQYQQQQQQHHNNFAGPQSDNVRKTSGQQKHAASQESGSCATSYADDGAVDDRSALWSNTTSENGSRSCSDVDTSVDTTAASKTQRSKGKGSRGRGGNECGPRGRGDVGVGSSPIAPCPRCSMIVAVPPPWVPAATVANGLPYYRVSNDGLDDEINDVLSYLALTDEERERRDHVILHIRAVVKALWCDVEVGVHGSYAYNMCLSSSDVDLTLGNLCQQPIECLHQLADEFGKIKEYQVETIPFAKVPLLKLHYLPADVKVDISFGITDALKSVALVNDFFVRYPVARSVALLTKAILRHYGYNNVVGGLPSFSIYLMVVHFFHQYPFLNHPQQLSAGKMMLQFLAFYGALFDFARTAIRFEPDLTSSIFKKPSVAAHRNQMLYMTSPFDPQSNVAPGATKGPEIQVLFWRSFVALIGQLSYASVPIAPQTITVLSCLLTPGVRYDDNAPEILLPQVFPPHKQQFPGLQSPVGASAMFGMHPSPSPSRDGTSPVPDKCDAETSTDNSNNNNSNNAAGNNSSSSNNILPPSMGVSTAVGSDVATSPNVLVDVGCGDFSIGADLYPVAGLPHDGWGGQRHGARMKWRQQQKVHKQQVAQQLAGVPPARGGGSGVKQPKNNHGQQVGDEQLGMGMGTDGRSRRSQQRHPNDPHYGRTGGQGHCRPNASNNSYNGSAAGTESDSYHTCTSTHTDLDSSTDDSSSFVSGTSPAARPRHLPQHPGTAAYYPNQYTYYGERPGRKHQGNRHKTVRGTSHSPYHMPAAPTNLKNRSHPGSNRGTPQSRHQLPPPAAPSAYADPLSLMGDPQGTRGGPGQHASTGHHGRGLKPLPGNRVEGASGGSSTAPCPAVAAAAVAYQAMAVGVEYPATSVPPTGSTAPPV